MANYTGNGQSGFGPDPLIRTTSDNARILRNMGGIYVCFQLTYSSYSLTYDVYIHWKQASCLRIKATSSVPSYDMDIIRLNAIYILSGGNKQRGGKSRKKKYLGKTKKEISTEDGRVEEGILKIVRGGIIKSNIITH